MTSNEPLLLVEKQTDTLIEQSKTKLQETLELKMKKQLGTYYFSPAINCSEEGK